MIVTEVGLGTEPPTESPRSSRASKTIVAEKEIEEPSVSKETVSNKSGLRSYACFPLSEYSLKIAPSTASLMDEL